MKKAATINKDSVENEVITRGKLIPILQDIKELIVSTAKGTENVLGGKIDKLDKRMTVVEAKVDATQHYMIKMEKRLDEKIDATRDSLNNKIDTKCTALDSKIDATRAVLDNKIDAIHAALDSKMDTLSNKFDKAAHRLDDHETRIILLETA